VDNIKVDLDEIRWGGFDWIGMTQDREKWRPLVNAVMKFGFHKIWMFLNGCTTIAWMKL
jgi:hypothetical protein